MPVQADGGMQAHSKQTEALGIGLGRAGTGQDIAQRAEGKGIAAVVVVNDDASTVGVAVYPA